MIHLQASVRVYLCLSACDMRKSFDGLHTLVRDYLEYERRKLSTGRKHHVDRIRELPMSGL